MPTTNAKKRPDNHRPMLYVLFRKYGLNGAIRIIRQDIGFDIRNRTNTAIPVNRARLFRSNQNEQNRYVASTFGVLDAVIDFASTEMDLTQSGFLDLGSGKGKALIAASRYPFSSIRGIEVSKLMHRTATRNISRLQLESDIELVNDCAANIQIKSHERLIYFFNSFTGSILERCLESIQQAHRNDSGLFVYVNPTEHDQVQRYFPLIQKVFVQPGNCEVNYYALPVNTAY